MPDSSDFYPMVEESISEPSAPREVEIFGLDDQCAIREARGLNPFPLIILTKSTVNTVFTALSTAANAATATVTFAGCIPTDASAIIGPSCT